MVEPLKPSDANAAEKLAGFGLRDNGEQLEVERAYL